MICKCKTSNCDCGRSCICNPFYCRCSVCRHLRKAADWGEPSEEYASFPDTGLVLPVPMSGVRNEAQTHESEASGDEFISSISNNKSVEPRRSPQSANPTSQASSAVGSEYRPENTLVDPDYLGSTSTSLPEFDSCRNGVHPGSSLQSSAHATGAISKNGSNKPKTSSASSSSVPPGEPDFTATRNFPTEQRICTPIDEDLEDSSSEKSNKSKASFLAGLVAAYITSQTIDDSATPGQHICTSKDQGLEDLSSEKRNSTTSPLAGLIAAYISSLGESSPEKSKNSYSSRFDGLISDYNSPRNAVESCLSEQGSCTSRGEDLEDSTSEKSKNSNASHLAELVAAACISSPNIDESFPSEQHVCTSKDEDLEDSSSEK